MPQTLTDTIELSEGDVDIVSINCDPWLDDGELVATVDSVTEIGSSDLTIDNIVVSSVQLEIKGETVAIGKAIQFRVAGQQAGTDYRLRYVITTDGTPTRTATRDVLACVYADATSA